MGRRNAMALLTNSSSRFRIPATFNQSKRWFQMNAESGATKEEMAGLQKDLFGNLSREKIRQLQQFPIPAVNNPMVKAHRSALFEKEKKRQEKDVGRIEKVKVEYQGLPESASLIMNKRISTPYHCAQHLGEMLVERSLVAEVNGQLWDMHRPIDTDCTLRLLHMKMKDEDPFQVNRVFWRTCSFLLGSVCESAFRDHLYVELHSFPSPNVRSGSFVYDVDLKMKDWSPNSDEMRVFSSEMIKLSRKRLPIERLEVNVDLALEMFQHNKYKSHQIPEIAQTSSDGKTICLYKVGDFVDISKGPMMTHTGHISRCTITAVHSLKSKTAFDTLYRIQGVALPSGILLNHFAYGIIEQRGRKFNSARIPGSFPAIADSKEVQSNTESNTDSEDSSSHQEEKKRAAWVG